MAKNCRLDTDITALRELVGSSDKANEEINALYAKAESIVADARKRGQDPAGALEAAKALYVRDIQASKERVLKTQVRYKYLADKIATAGNAYKAIVSMLYSQTSGKNSIGEIPMAHLAESNFSRSAGVLSQALDEVPGSAKILESGAMDLEIRKYIKGELADASPQVRAIGDAIKKSNDRALNLKRVAGFTVGYQQNRVSRQVHSARGMADIGKQGYITEAMTTFDFDKMGINTKPEQLEFVAKFYDKVVNGQRGKWEVSDELSQIARDSGKRFEQEKKIFFKDAEAEHRYNTNVNKKTLSQLIFDEMEYDSRQLAAAQQFGPNFRSSLEKLVSDPSITPTQRRELKAKFEHESSGRFDAGTGRISRYGANIRKITDISKLSSALISTATDFAYTAGTLASNTDMNLFKASAKAVTGFFGTLPASKRKEVARHAHLYLADMISDTQANRYGGEIDTAQDALSWAHKSFMKYTGLSAQSQAARLNGAETMMGQLADMSEKEFGSLPTGVQDHFTRYGIGAKDWDKMRVASAELSDGIKVISPESIAREYGTSSADSLRMQQGLSSYLQTVAENSSPTATGAQTYWKNLIDPDTIHGQLALFFGQYKTFSFAALKTMSSIQGVQQTSAARSWALTGGTAALATGWGYTALVLKDVAAGNEPRELSPQTMLEAFDQGGAGGLYFSMMAKDWDNAYGSLAADLAGPSFKLIQDALGAGHNMLDVARYAAEGNDPKAKKAASKLLKKVYDHSPKLPLIGNAINRTILEATQRSMDLPVSKRKGKPLWQ